MADVNSVVTDSESATESADSSRVHPRPNPILRTVTTLDVKCGLYEINKNNRANSKHGQSPVQKMFQERTEATLDRRDPEPGPVLTLRTISHWRE